MPIMLFFILFVQDGNLKWIAGYIDNPKSAGLAIGVGLCASLFLMGVTSSQQLHSHVMEALGL